MRAGLLLLLFILALSNIAFAELPDIEGWVWLDYRSPTAPLLEAEQQLVVLDPDNYLSGEVETLKQAGHIVLAYLCIGEAESWRAYWHKISWESWVVGPSSRRSGSYLIRFYSAYTWAGVLKDYVEDIIEFGYQGLFLDPAYALSYYPDKAEDMADLVQELAEEARYDDPDAYVVLFEGGELLEYSQIVMEIDGLAEEGVWWDSDWLRSSAVDTMLRKDYLIQARGLGITPLVMEYADGDAAIIEVETLADGEGFIPFFVPKEWGKYW